MRHARTCHAHTLSHMMRHVHAATRGLRVTPASLWYCTGAYDPSRSLDPPPRLIGDSRPVPPHSPVSTTSFHLQRHHRTATSHGRPSVAPPPQLPPPPFILSLPSPPHQRDARAAAGVTAPLRTPHSRLGGLERRLCRLGAAREAWVGLLVGGLAPLPRLLLPCALE